MLNRVISLYKDTKYSIFFFGARKCGKSTYLNKEFKDSLYVDLLDTKQYAKYMASPYMLKEEILALKESNKLKEPVIIDEIQKIPVLLNDVHWLIENAKIRFILCGSSARKLHKSGVNLLGGRALSKHCFPLVSQEFKDSNVKFDLLKVMQKGLIPIHYLDDENKHEILLESYVNEYLYFEIKEEGAVRNLPAFSAFLDSIGFCNGELVNYSNIAMDCGVSSTTIKEYYQIICDTLLGTFVTPYVNKEKRNCIRSTPKFYLFDIGVANKLAKASINSLEGHYAGKSFEHFIYLEILAYSKYNDKFIDINFWRTKSGLEVDFIISKNKEIKLAIECKLTKLVKKTSLKGLKVFASENKVDKLIVVSQDDKMRLLHTDDDQNIFVLPWQNFLEDLWSGEFF